MAHIYKHIGYYYDPEDIIELFPFKDRKEDDIVDTVLKYMKEGWGAFHETPAGEVEDISNFDDDDDAYFSIDNEYIVVLSEGDLKSLFRKEEGHGFYIDVWQYLGNVDDYDDFWDGAEKEDLDTLTKKALDLTEELKTVISDIQRIKNKQKR